MSDECKDPRVGPIDLRYAEILRRHIDDPSVTADLNVYARRMYFSKTLIHWEIYKKVAKIPGDVVECGVFKGESLFNWARFMEMLNTGDRSKRVIAFDHFQGLQGLTENDTSDGRADSREGGWNPSHFKDTLFDLIDLFHEDSFVPKAPRIEIVEGDIRETAKARIEKELGLRIALLHLDCDLYEPTLAALEAFYPRVVTGGIVLFDEYGMAPWPGESRAFEDYFGGTPPRLEKLTWVSAPGGWFVKSENTPIPPGMTKTGIADPSSE